MTAREARLRELFDRARELPTDRVEGWLDAACGDDPRLADELRELLRCADRHDTPLDAPLIPPGTHLDGRAPPPSPEPRRVGAYAIVRRIGGGAMGTVYEAIQENPRRVVALKVLRAGIATDALLRRFQLEADVLARLDHPAIARIHEAGTADLGHGATPYLAMELVDGLPLDAWAAARRPGLRERLELLVRIGEGLAHAHGRGVLHRDVKPANILVDGHGDPHLVDFGVARSLETDVRATTLRTNDGQLVGTLQYMSPEQACGDAAAIDARSDVYALGVVAYELLGGRLPYDLDELPLPRALQCILETEPPRLGTLDRALRGDVATIVATALEKDRDRRYSSMGELVADLRRHLSHEPIAARRTSTFEQMVKFARRHRALAAGLLVGAVLLALGIAAMAVGLVSARRQTAAAEQATREMAAALAEAEAVTRFVTGALLAVGADERGYDARVTEVLDEAAARLDSDFADFPGVAARLHHTLGRAYAAVGRLDSAREHARRATELCRATFGEHDERTLAAQAELVALLRDTDRLDEARELGTRVEAAQVALHGPHSPAALRALLERARLLREQEDLAGAAEVLGPAAERAAAALGAEHEVTCELRLALGDVLRNLGSHAEAEQLVRGVATVLAARHGADAAVTLEAERELAGLLLDAGRLDESQQLHERLLGAYTARLGPDHPTTALVVGQLAQLDFERGRYAEALARFTDAADRLGRTLGASHSTTREMRMEQAHVLHRLDRLDEAGALLAGLVDGHRPGDGAGSALYLGALRELGVLRLRGGRPDEARALLTESLEGLRALLGDDVAIVAHVLMDLSAVERVASRGEQAEALLGRARDVYRRLYGPDSPDELRARVNLGAVQAEQGRLAEAEATLVGVFDPLRERLGDEHPDILVLLALLADLRVRQERYAEAESIAGTAFTLASRQLPLDHQLVRAPRETLAKALRAQGRADEALAILVDVRAQLVAAFGEGSIEALTATQEHALALVDLGRTDEARALADAHLAALAARSDDPLHLVPAQLLAAMVRGPDGAGQLEQLHVRARELWGDEHPTTRDALAALEEARAAR